MFRLVSDFSTAWEQESANTVRLLAALTDASLSRSMDDQGRTLGKLAWHLVETLPEMLPSAGLSLDFTLTSEHPPESAGEIATAYAKGARLLGEAVAAQWSDADLLEETDMYGMRWKRGFTLQCLIVHQAHHRGQMTVLMRQAGLPVPGMVGPSREEWVAMGAPAPE